MSDTLEPPVEGMNKMPFGADDPLMMGCFIACVRAAATQDEAIKEFTDKTGMDLRSLVCRTPIERMIDEACGRPRIVLAAFCDYVAEFIWGLHDAPDPSPLD